jgi:hypothetical protein
VFYIALETVLILSNIVMSYFVIYQVMGVIFGKSS